MSSGKMELLHNGKAILNSDFELNTAYYQCKLDMGPLSFSLISILDVCCVNKPKVDCVKA